MAQQRARQGTHRISLDGDWTLFDLGAFSRVYTQVYSVLYVLDDDLIPLDDSPVGEFGSVSHVFRAFPWRGGYSAVNFYNSVRVRVPPSRRPSVRSIRYASPGVLELALIVPVATSIAAIVYSFATSAKHLHSLYHDIRKGMRERELMQINVKRADLALRRDQRDFARESTDQLADLMGLEQVDRLRLLTGHEVAELKILLSLFRRFQQLRKIEEEGRVKF